MNENIKKIILSDIKKNLNGYVPVYNLDYDEITINIYNILNIINDKDQLKKTLGKEKNIWLINKRLGYYNDGIFQDFIDIYNEYGRELLIKYNISPGLNDNDIAMQLERKFCLCIKKINSSIKKFNINNNQEEKVDNDYLRLINQNNCLINKINKLKEKNLYLEKKNEELLERIFKLEEENQNYFVEIVNEKVKHLLIKNQ